MSNQDKGPVIPADEVLQTEQGKQPSSFDKIMSRRALIASIGMAAGAAVASGGLVQTIHASGNPHDQIGDLSDLETNEKSNLVGAINENVGRLTDLSGEIGDRSVTGWRGNPE